MSASTESILRPVAFLGRNLLLLPDLRPNPVVNGQLCPAALRTFEKGEVAPQEFETFVEALRRFLPEQEGVTPAQRFAVAADDALDLVARILNKEPNPEIEKWVMEFVPFIESDEGARIVLSHLQSTLALYTIVAGIKYGE